MSGGTEILQEYLVKLGFVTDAIGIKKMDTALGAIGKKVFSVGGSVASMALATEVAVGKFSDSMEKMYYASKLADSSVIKLKSLSFAGKSVGIMGDQIGNAVHNMAQSLRLNPGTQQLIESFGVKVQGRDVSDVAMDTMRALSRQPEWLGAQWANKLFGMDADTYHLLIATPGALDKVSEAQKRNIDLYKQYGMSADEAAAQSVKYMNSLRDLENRMGILSDVILKRVAPAFNYLNEGMAKTLDRTTKYFSTVSGSDLLRDVLLGKPGASKEQTSPEIKKWYDALFTNKPRNGDPDWKRHIDWKKKTDDWIKENMQFSWLHKDYWNKSKSAPPSRVSASGSSNIPFSDIDISTGLPIGTMASVMRVESKGNKNAISRKGAKGRFQIMDATASKPGLGLSGWNPSNTANNQDASHAALYLAALVKKYGSLPLALAAYNAGMGNVDKAGGIPNFPETQAYVKDVMGGIKNARLGASSSGTNVSIHQENNFNINGSGGKSTADAIAAGQSRTNADLVRNLSTAVQ